ncbi:hypothetical protein UFOVP1204_64 [uncultured Caudovirales phage]|uniref:Uncharacterized protein n=1 Tax=uncultured Caudovirales phage TaxID=2100421 RepID=A0A6J5R6Z8_9CAUD|nr:hypothetical protein UFOVP473_37 [uncultured Caudovirales phage]CAB4176579.1 hypothetical protein UFOVP983_37 [uncultured Caudovirales phage]CAB4190366.1 hypothetical protein UFOVP1204_64 [uncultured Caudovirales phage]
MAGTVWTKFFWSDWSNDPALRLCSLAARGLWMHCLCVAAESQPPGYVTVNGSALTESELAQLAGSTESEVRNLLGELDRKGVFNRDAKGRIYSRRMIRDAQRIAIAQKNGKRGGNPNLCKDGANPSPDNPPVKGWDKGRDKPHKPYSNKPYSARTRPPEIGGAGGPSLETVFVECGSAGWNAWVEYARLTGTKPPMPIVSRQLGKTGDALPSEFPPDYRKEAVA